MVKKTILSIALVLAWTFHLSPVEVKKITVDTYQAFQEGKLIGTSLDHRGRLLLGPQVEKIQGPSREYYLALDISENGDIYVGTGHNAAIYKVAAQGDIQEIFNSDYLDIYALHVKSNGDVYAGTSPNGRLYKIKKGKEITVKNGSEIFDLKDKQAIKSEQRKDIEIFNPDEKYIWDIKEDRSGNIIFAVGNSGGVYKIDETGNAAKIFSSEDAHIISLYVTRNNSILAGSGDRGVLYKIDKRKVKVLFDSPLEEIKGICEDKEGKIYFAAARGINDKKKNVKEDSFGFKSFQRTKKDSDKEEPKEKSILYCLHTNGIVEEIWSSEEEYIYTIHYDEKLDRVIAGTGNFGRVYSIKSDGSYEILYESESAQVFKITGKGKGFTFISNNTASISRIDESLNTKGSYLSEVYDLEIQSKLGKIYWDAYSSQNGEVQLFIRAGNSNIPDKTWTDWSAPFSDKENSTIDISQVRYFQIKAILNAASITQPPALENFRVYYIQSNLSPQLKRIGISKPIPAVENAKATKKNNKYKYLNIKWNAVDPNDDRLKYNIYLKKVEHSNWILLKENGTKNSIELKTELFEDGKYVIKVTADDALANPPSIARTNSKVSPPFIIDSTAPMVSNLTVTGKTITFGVNDRTSIIAKVQYSLDGEIWYPLFPEDGINDSKSENFNFKLESRGTKPQKIVFIKVADEFNNYKVFQKEI